MQAQLQNQCFAPGRALASSFSFDPDALAFFTAAGITNAAQKLAVNTLVLSLKGTGTPSFWSRDVLIYPLVGGSASSHAVNLKTPGTYNLTYSGSGVTHSALGMKGDGVAGWAKTGYLQALLNSVRVMIYVQAEPTLTNRMYFGAAAIVVPSGRHFVRWNGVGASDYCVGDTTTTSIGGSGVGCRFSQRFQAASKQQERAGGAWVTDAVASTGIPTRYYTLLAYNNSGTVPSGTPTSFSDCILSGFSLGSPLDTGGGNTEALAYKAIWDTFETALGRGHP